MERSGRCLCGEVTYRGTVEPKFSACHCNMCLRWSGGPLLAAGPANVVFSGEEYLRVIQSSKWAERGFCTKCGSSMFFRLTTGTYAGMMTVGYGTLDNRDGFEMDKEWFHDLKPDTYAFVGEREHISSAAVAPMLEAMLAKE